MAANNSAYTVVEYESPLQFSHPGGMLASVPGHLWITPGGNFACDGESTVTPSAVANGSLLPSSFAGIFADLPAPLVSRSTPTDQARAKNCVPRSSSATLNVRCVPCTKMSRL